MGRRRKILKNQFTEAYKQAESMVELAKLLDVSLPTAYGYVKRWGVSILTHDSRTLTLEIFRAYKGLITMEQLAVEFSLTRQAIRYQLWKVVHLLNKKNSKLRWPLPQKLGHLKVLQILDAQPDLFDQPDKIAKMTNLIPTIVEEYLAYAFEHRTEKHNEA